MVITIDMRNMHRRNQ